MNSFLINLLTFALLFIPYGGDKSPNASIYIATSEGLALDWDPNLKITWNDFKAQKKLSQGFAIASTYSDFEYEFIRQNDKNSIRIFVRFYCDKSWKNSWYRYDDDTDHITNGYQQRIWNNKISEELKELEAYAQYHKIIIN